MGDFWHFYYSFSVYFELPMFYFTITIAMIKVLIVEDDDTIAEMYAMKCAFSGINAHRAQNGLDALSILQDFTPDAVLLDLQMPEMNGEQFLEAFRGRPQYATTPVLILTNMGENEIPKGVFEHDVAGVIVKANCTPAEVIEKLKEVTSSTQPSSPADPA